MKIKTQCLIILSLVASSCSTVLPPGQVVTHYPSGKTHLRYYTSDGLKNGPWEEYDQNGNLIHSGSFFKDKHHGYEMGVWKRKIMYDEDGNKVRDISINQ